MEFICKEFALNHSHSTMKVGTDSILLSGLVAEFFAKKQKEDYNFASTQIKNILDIGTGCGILSLCVAQIFEKADIMAIDIDDKSIIEAHNNFQSSKFYHRMNTANISVQSFSKTSNKTFDLIISNPPFFTNSLQSPNERRTNARHNNSLSLMDFVLSCKTLLSENSYVAIVLPEKEMSEIQSLFKRENINLVMQTDVFPKPNTQIKRKVCIFQNSSSISSEIKSQSLYIRTANNEYSKYYKFLTSPFLL